MLEKEPENVNCFREIAEVLYTENFRYIYKVVIVLVQDKSIVEDIVQEAFLKAYKNIDQLRDTGKFRSWLTSIAVNICRNHFAKSSKESQMEKLFENSSSLSAEDQFLEIVKKEELEQTLKNLEYNDREILILKYHYGFSSREIADYYKITVENVHVRVFRAREKFKRKITEGGADNVR